MREKKGNAGRGPNAARVNCLYVRRTLKEAIRGRFIKAVRGWNRFQIATSELWDPKCRVVQRFSGDPAPGPTACRASTKAPRDTGFSSGRWRRRLEDTLLR